MFYAIIITYYAELNETMDDEFHDVISICFTIETNTIM